MRVVISTYTRDSFTGLDYADQRMYASSLGRFNTADPYRASAGASDPGSWNRYSYVGGDPVNLYDPNGLWAVGSSGADPTDGESQPCRGGLDPEAIQAFLDNAGLGMPSCIVGETAGQFWRWGRPEVQLSTPFDGNCKITSPYALRTNPITGRPQNHTGVDIKTDGAEYGVTQVHSITAGTVTEIGSTNSGDWRQLEFPDGDNY